MKTTFLTTDWNKKLTISCYEEDFFDSFTELYWDSGYRICIEDNSREYKFQNDENLSYYEIEYLFTSKSDEDFIEWYWLDEYDLEELQNKKKELETKFDIFPINFRDRWWWNISFRNDFREDRWTNWVILIEKNERSEDSRTVFDRILKHFNQRLSWELYSCMIETKDIYKNSEWKQLEIRDREDWVWWFFDFEECKNYLIDEYDLKIDETTKKEER